MAEALLIDGKLGSPRYLQVYQSLYQWIAQGRYARGSRLETEHQLCALFGVSRITVRKALDMLADDGLVKSIQGKGTFVCADHPQLPVRADMDQRIRKSRELARNSTIKRLRISSITAPADICDDLHLPPDSKAIHTSYVRVLRQQAVGFVESYIPTQLGIHPAPEDFRTSTMLTLLEDKGIALSGIDHLIGATLADSGLASMLGIQVGAPLVRIRMILLDTDHSPVEHISAFFRADQYEHHMFMSRDAATGAFSTPSKANSMPREILP